MLAKIEDLLYIIEEFCAAHYITILICTNALALILAFICLARTSKRRNKALAEAYAADMKLNLSIETAAVTVGSVVAGESQKEASTEPASKDGESVSERPGEYKQSSSESEKEEPVESSESSEQEIISVGEEYYTSRSGRIYSKEDVLRQIRD